MQQKLQSLPCTTAGDLNSRPREFTSGQAAETRANSGRGLLIVNADDWGRNRVATDRTLDCVRRGAVSSVSAMVFMSDSERAAALAVEHGVDAGLHLNFTSRFSASRVPARPLAHQERISRYLLRHRFAQVVFHPGLTASFAYVVMAQREEFTRLYGFEPIRLDGHHHMHLCANVLGGGLLPPETIVRRSFSFERGEKGALNRTYRRLIDSALGRHHRITDFFFSIQPLTATTRLKRIVGLSRGSVVELESHPEDLSEYAFLMGAGFGELPKPCAIANHFGPVARSAVSSWLSL